MKFTDNRVSKRAVLFTQRRKAECYLSREKGVEKLPYTLEESQTG
jgi:hypothetical protein